jgi:hypothetical protein
MSWFCPRQAAAALRAEARLPGRARWTSWARPSVIRTKAASSKSNGGLAVASGLLVDATVTGGGEVWR